MFEPQALRWNATGERRFLGRGAVKKNVELPTRRPSACRENPKCLNFFPAGLTPRCVRTRPALSGFWGDLARSLGRYFASPGTVSSGHPPAKPRCMASLRPFLGPLFTAPRPLQQLPAGAGVGVERAGHNKCLAQNNKSSDGRSEDPVGAHNQRPMHSHLRRRHAGRGCVPGPGGRPRFSQSGRNLVRDHRSPE